MDSSGPGQGKWWDLLSTVLNLVACIKCQELLDWLLKDDYNAWI